VLSLADGRRLCVRRRGRPRDGTLVLLHGLLDSAAGWSELCQELTGPFVAVDIPGFGDSDAPAEPTIECYARDVLEGLALLGVKRFSLVGHSLGGAIATAMAEMVPDRVQALILLAPAGFGRMYLAETATLPGVRSLVGAALPGILSSQVMVTTGYITMVTNGRLPHRDLVLRITSSGRRLVAGTEQAIRAVAAAGQSPQAFHRRRVAYSGPVTAVWGDCDRIVPTSHRAGVRAAFPQADVHIWRGMGHHPVVERLTDLVALVTNIAPSTGHERPAVRSATTRPPLAEAA
jgi:pimeloyl-ACP methyl ester carboxylesterase